MSVEPANPAIAKPGRYRWRVCAMLLAATTINYIDRQVLGVLAPFLQQQIGWNEVEYGYIVTAFQAAYAIGLLCAGAVIDRFGTRIGYAIAIGIWSLAAMSRALAASVVGFALARFALGLGEARQFSGGDQDRGRVVSPTRARPGGGDIQFRLQHRRSGGTAAGAGGGRALGLAGRVPLHWLAQRPVAGRLAQLVSRAGTATSPWARRSGH